MKHFWIFVLVSILLLSACASNTPIAQPTLLMNNLSEPRTLTVFAAASLTDAFIEIGKNFDSANDGVTTTFNFASSRALRTQLEQGAVADVFASANTQEMNTLIMTDTLIGVDSSQLFITNILQVIIPANNPANLQSLGDLSTPGIKIVLAAEEVPVGKYARQVLDKLNNLYGVSYKDAVLANVVSNEDNVKQVVTKIQLGEADAGIVYISDAVAAPDLKTIAIPSDYNVIANYPIAPLINAPQPDLANAFIAYVLSPDGQSILNKWGFTPASQ